MRPGRESPLRKLILIQPMYDDKSTAKHSHVEMPRHRMLIA